MICDLKSSKIDCIIIKDLSHASREFIGSRYYIEK